MITRFTLKTVSIVIMLSLVSPALAINPQVIQLLQQEERTGRALEEDELRTRHEVNQYRTQYIFSSMEYVLYVRNNRHVADSQRSTEEENRLLNINNQARENFQQASDRLIGIRTRINQRFQVLSQVTRTRFTFPAIEPLPNLPPTEQLPDILDAQEAMQRPAQRQRRGNNNPIHPSAKRRRYDN